MTQINEAARVIPLVTASRQKQKPETSQISVSARRSCLPRRKKVYLKTLTKQARELEKERAKMKRSLDRLQRKYGAVLQEIERLKKSS